MNKGVGCATCHGRVDKMPLMYQEASLQMSGAWTATAIRRSSSGRATRCSTWRGERPADDPGLGERLVKEYKIADVQQLTSCSTCHR